MLDETRQEVSELFWRGLSTWVDRGLGNGQEIEILVVGVAWIRIVLQGELWTFLDSIWGERGWDRGIRRTCRINHVIRLRYQRSDEFRENPNLELRNTVPNKRPRCWVRGWTLRRPPHMTAHRSRMRSSTRRHLPQMWGSPHRQPEPALTSPESKKVTPLGDWTSPLEERASFSDHETSMILRKIPIGRRVESLF